MTVLHRVQVAVEHAPLTPIFWAAFVLALAAVQFLLLHNSCRHTTQALAQTIDSCRAQTIALVLAAMQVFLQHKDCGHETEYIHNFLTNGPPEQVVQSNLIIGDCNNASVPCTHKNCLHKSAV